MSLMTRVLFSCTIALTMLLATKERADAQTARLAGFVYDQHRQAVPDATVSLTNEATSQVRTTKSDRTGAYGLAGMSPARYRVEVIRSGFAPWRRTGVVLEVQQEARLDVSLELAGVSEVVAVEAPSSPMGTRDGSLGLVVDRRLIGNTPLAGRTFQALIELAPGVVYAPSAAGTFSINGQRRDSNYFTIDGVSANFNITGNLASQASVGTGEAPASGATGGYNGLVSVDAIQEVRVQTSSFAPEYGRTPGGQVSIVTRSGSNQLHGSLAGIYRPDALQANDWYANYAGLATPEFGQQIYAGTLGGRLVADRLFYFGSYERIRLRNPTTVITEVPSIALRSSVPGLVGSLLAGWPLPTGPDLDASRAVYAINDPSPTHEDAPALRVDAQLSSQMNVFGRYAHLRSTVAAFAGSLSESARGMDVVTVGATWVPTSSLVGEARINYSSATAGTMGVPTAIGGAVPPPEAAWPSFTDPSLDYVSYRLSSGYGLSRGNFGDATQRQVNVVGTVSYGRGAHHAKFGFDVRVLSPSVTPSRTVVSAAFASLADLQGGVASLVVYGRTHDSAAKFRNFSMFAQDTLRYGRRASMTYGVRWDVNPAPSFSGEQPFRAVGVSDVARLDVMQSDSALWPTRYNNLAPRVGLSYALTEDARTTLSAGGGLFYDLGTQSSGNLLSSNLFPFARSYIATSVALPIPEPPPGSLDPVRLGQTPYGGTIYLADSDMVSPRVAQWNVKAERETANGQLLSVAYSGNRGARLLTTQQYLKPNERFSGTVNILRSNGRSTYHALLVQYRRRALSFAQLTASYTLSSAKDNVSTSASSAPDRPPSEEWGPSEFDVRHNFVAAASLELPRIRSGWLTVANGWGIDVFLRARSGFPLGISTGRDGLNIGLGSAERPNVVGGRQIWLTDASVPAGQRLNRDAFTLPPIGEQGDLARNSIRGLPAKQVDLSLRRSFTVARFNVQIRLDAYNAFNWPQHGRFVTNLSDARFGISQASLNSRSSSIQSASSQYSPGGPRTCDIQLRLGF